MESFEPFVSKTNQGKISLPDFDVELKSVASKTVFDKPVEKVSGPPVKKTSKKSIKDLNIDMEKLKNSSGKQGYSKPELEKIARQMKDLGVTIKTGNVKKPQIAQSILNALEESQ